jgi:hypothetical protein
LVGRLDSASAAAPGCTVTAERWTEADCTLERTVDCVDTANGLQTHVQAVSHQTTDDGSRIEGILTLTGKDLSGSPCA